MRNRISERQWSRAGWSHVKYNAFCKFKDWVLLPDSSGQRGLGQFSPFLGSRPPGRGRLTGNLQPRLLNIHVHVQVYTMQAHVCANTPHTLIHTYAHTPHMPMHTERPPQDALPVWQHF